jgi:dTDP-4-amino-4,6-dideoxygalactose transaminase
MSKLVKEPVYVTSPFLPPLQEFEPYLKEIWRTHLLTNGGPFHEKLERALCEYLGVKYISLFSNGTLALVTALQALKISGEVITTPFSFVATSHSIWWNGLKPVFVDIDPFTYNINPDAIEAAITSKTQAIIPVHVYGTPCNVIRIKEIADNYGLKVIYDACHTFGVKLNERPILNFGDLSVMSFHATKVYNTFEGGAIVCHDEVTKKRIDNLKNFGFVGETTVVAPGINAKMNEVQAAMGLLQLKHIDAVINKRKEICEIYRTQLKNITGITFLEDNLNIKSCYSFFPIFIDKDKFGVGRDEIYEELKKNSFFCRRYFYPLISQFPIYRGLESAQPGRMTVAEKATLEVICLPLYPTLILEIVKEICAIIKSIKPI